MSYELVQRTSFISKTNLFGGPKQKDMNRRLILGKVPSSQVEAAKKKKKQEEKEEKEEKEEEELSCGILMWGWLGPGLLAAHY